MSEIADANKEICWISVAPYPFEVGFTMCHKALRKLSKELKDEIPKGEEFDNKHAAAIVWFFNPPDKFDTYAICYMPKPNKNVTEVQAAGMLAHECLHIVQRIWDKIYEQYRGEAEAYLIQHIFQVMYFHYRKAVGLENG